MAEIDTSKLLPLEEFQRMREQIALAEGCSHVLSFDRAAVRSAGMVLLA